MSRPKLSREEQVQQDARDLAKLGYAQQLFREMGGFSNFAISFSIISILTGAVLLFGYGLKFAGPAINTIGWPIVSLFTLCVAASMGELASAYPTAGGLYYWALRLGGRGWAWVTAWFNMVGQVTITAGINVAAATYLIGAATRIFGFAPDATVPIFGKIDSWSFQIAVMILLMIPQILINIYGIKLTARLNDFSVWWHIGGVFLILGLLIFLGKHRNSFEFLFKSVTAVNPLEASSAEIGGKMVPALVIGKTAVPSPLFAMFPALAEIYKAAPFGLVFVLAMLQAQWTYTGYDASAHVAEETVMARLNTAWGVFLSVAVSAVVGYLLIVALTWSIPRGDVAATAADPYPVLFVVYENLPSAFAHLVAIIIGGAMWLCGCSSITSMARMWYAFARDDGMPGAKYLKRVHPIRKTPTVSILVTSALSVVVCLYAAAYYVVTSISVITLYVAYIIPIYLNWRNRRAKAGEWVTAETAPWNLGRWAPAINVVAIVWTVFIVIVFSIPPNELVLWTMLGLCVLLASIWTLSARHRFHASAKAPAATQAPGF
jgi:amino acid transporter